LNGIEIKHRPSLRLTKETVEASRAYKQVSPAVFEEKDKEELNDYISTINHILKSETSAIKKEDVMEIISWFGQIAAKARKERYSETEIPSGTLRTEGR